MEPDREENDAKRGRSDGNEGNEGSKGSDGNEGNGETGGTDTWAAKADPERERLVFGHRFDWERAGRVAKFEGVTPETARVLLDEGYVRPDARVDGLPTMAEVVSFVEWAEASEPVRAGDARLTVHGRMVAPDQPDVGVVLEGVKYEGRMTDEFVREFARLFYRADSFMLEKDLHARCWQGGEVDQPQTGSWPPEQ